MQYASRQNNAPSHTAPSDVYQGDVQSDEGSNSGFSYTIEINQAAHTLRLYDGSNKILFETGDISLPVSNRLKTGDFKMYEARQRNDAYAPGSIKYDPENPQVIITGAGPNNEYGADVQSHRNVTRTGLRTRNDVMQKILGYVQNSDNTLVKVR
jgi:hypothetical protein